MTSAASVEGRERLRLFCALRLPGDSLDLLVEWQEQHVGGGRPTRRDQLHLTLAFLGSRPADEVDAIAGELGEAAAAVERPLLTVARYRETRSVGMLVFDDDEGRAGALAADLHGRLQRLGLYEPEKRPWLPHLTVVRFRQPLRLRPPLDALRTGVRFMPSDAAVYLSRLRPTGAEYEALRIVALGG